MIFYRHPKPEAAPGLCYGRMDLDISAEGAQQVADACAAPVAAAKVISSPAKRALALAQPLAAAMGAPLTIDERLWEMDFGAWEGQLWSEIDRRQSDPWAEDVYNRAPPNGETFAALTTRVTAAIEDAGPDACIVAHAGPIRAAMMILGGATFQDVFARQIPFASPIHISQAVSHG